VKIAINRAHIQMSYYIWLIQYNCDIFPSHLNGKKCLKWPEFIFPAIIIATVLINVSTVVYFSEFTIMLV